MMAKSNISKVQIRLGILIVLLILSAVAISPHFSDGKLKTNLRFGLDLEGGSYIQLELKGALVMVEVDQERALEEILESFGYEVDVTQATALKFKSQDLLPEVMLQSLRVGNFDVDPTDDGYAYTLVSDQRSMAISYLSTVFQTTVMPIERSDRELFEIRKSVSREELEDVMKLVDGRVVYYEDTISKATQEQTKQVLDRKLNLIGLSDIVVRSAGDKYILIDLAGLGVDKARDIVGKPGIFEIKVLTSTGEKAHVLYGEDIIFVDTPMVFGQNQQIAPWGVGFTLNERGANALQQAAVIYGALEDAEAHPFIMTLDESEVYNASLSPDLVQTLHRGVVTRLMASTGIEEEGHAKADDLYVHLKAGALPVSIEVIGSGEVSSDLGAAFKKELAIAVVLALIVVSGIVYYRYRLVKVSLPMLCISFSEILIILGFASLIKWQLDLASLIGIIATVGTGVDQLLIITDELFGKEFEESVKWKVSRALKIVITAALTTIVAMIPLGFLGFGKLQGFALVTIFGLLVGVLLTRPAYTEIIRKYLIE